MSVYPFNPLDKVHLGESVGQAMLKQPPQHLASITSFYGAGIYAIYYTGGFKSYNEISKRNLGNKFSAPIYVGKAVPSGARKGNSYSGNTTSLYKRILDHKKSIEAAVNLDVNDFYFRCLVVDDIWIPLGESLLIARFYPVWNSIIDGFGNHAPGKGRYNGMRPRWDVLHPGRTWADKCQPRQETMEQIMHEAENFLLNNPPPDSNIIIAV